MSHPTPPPPVPQGWTAPPADAGVQPVLLPTAPATTDTPTILATVLPIGVLALLLVAHVLGSSNFPSNAPVEQVMALGVSIDIVAAILALGIRAVVITPRPRAAFAGPTGVGPFAIVGVVLAVATLLAFLLLSALPGVSNAVDGADQRYMSWSAGLFWLGIPWVVGVFFSAAAFRPGRGAANSALALGSLAVQLLVAAGTAAAAIAYGAGLTE